MGVGVASKGNKRKTGAAQGEGTAARRFLRKRSIADAARRKSVLLKF